MIRNSLFPSRRDDSKKSPRVNDPVRGPIDAAASCLHSSLENTAFAVAPPETRHMPTRTPKRALAAVFAAVTLVTSVFAVPGVCAEPPADVVVGFVDRPEPGY